MFVRMAVCLHMYVRMDVYWHTHTHVRQRRRHVLGYIYCMPACLPFFCMPTLEGLPNALPAASPPPLAPHLPGWPHCIPPCAINVTFIFGQLCEQLKLTHTDTAEQQQQQRQQQQRRRRRGYVGQQQQQPI